MFISRNITVIYTGVCIYLCALHALYIFVCHNQIAFSATTCAGSEIWVHLKEPENIKRTAAVLVGMLTLTQASIFLVHVSSLSGTLLDGSNNTPSSIIDSPQ